jgi:hypothetical protein
MVIIFHINFETGVEDGAVLGRAAHHRRLREKAGLEGLGRPRRRGRGCGRNRRHEIYDLHCNWVLLHSVKERSCRFEISSVEAFGEAVVDRLEQRQRVRRAALIAQQPGEARGGAQFP